MTRGDARRTRAAWTPAFACRADYGGTAPGQHVGCVATRPFLDRDGANIGSTRKGVDIFLVFFKPGSGREFHASEKLYQHFRRFFSPRNPFRHGRD